MTRSIKYTIASVLLTVLFFSCKTYYKIRTGQSSNIDSLSKTNRVFILRSGNNAYMINNFSLSADKQTAYCQLDILPGNHDYHLGYSARQSEVYKKNNPVQRDVVNEVHLFTNYDSLAKPGKYAFSLNNINKIEILEHDTKRTTSNHVVSAIIITAGVAAAVMVIAVALKSSCPFISAWDGKEFSLQGEIYGGSIFPQLERRDYLALKMAPTADQTLQIRITNELKERQFTDHVRLWEISHPAGTSMLVDEKGNLRSVCKPQAPVAAVMNQYIDVRTALLKAGDHEMTAMDDTSSVSGTNEITMTFKRPLGAGRGTLVLGLKNSYFLDLLYGEFAKGFGTFYAAYMKEQKKKSKEELLKWVKQQNIPLEVAVKTASGWQTITALTTVGPLAYRQTAIDIPLPADELEDIQIRLKSGFNFWEIDYAGMDFSSPTEYMIEKLEPVSAIDEKGENVWARIISEDGVYLDQPQIGNAATISFKSRVLAGTGQEKTYILETKGYYEHLRDFTNPPDRKFLESFRKPGAFPLYGIKLYKQMLSEKMIAASH